MPDFENLHDNKIEGKVTPAVIVEWSKRRAWHGDTVSIAVRSWQVPDGTAVTVKILATDNSVIDTVTGLSLTGGKADKDYPIQWKGKTVSEDKHAFALQAFIDDPKLESKPSPVLLIDLQPPVLSI